MAFALVVKFFVHARIDASRMAKEERENAGSLRDKARGSRGGKKKPRTSPGYSCFTSIQCFGNSRERARNES